MIKYKVVPFKNLYERVYEKSKIKMKAYTAVQKKLLEFIFIVWTKDEAFDPGYQAKQSRDEESVPSFASVPQEPTIAGGGEEKKLKFIKQK